MGRSHCILLLNTKDHVGKPNSYLADSVAEELRVRFGTNSIELVTSSNVVDKALQCKPDALICFDGEEAQHDVILQVRKMGVPVIGWLTEHQYELSRNLDSHNIYDFIFTNERAAATIAQFIRRQKPKGQLIAPRRILVCIHHATSGRVFGGMEILTEELVRHLQASWKVFLLYPYSKDAVLYWRLVDGNSGQAEDECVGDVSFTDQVKSYDYSQAAKFKRIILSKQISLVHFQHWLTFPLELPLAVSELGIPYTLTLGDYYAICHKYTLLNNFGVYCQPDSIPLETCDVCLRATHGYPFASQLIRREIVSRVLLNSKEIICCSKFQCDLIGKLFPKSSGKIQVIEPHDGSKIQSIPRDTVEVDRPLNVALTGNFTKHKGADTFILIMDYYRNSTKINFYVFGRINSDCQMMLAEAGLNRNANVHLRGGYSPDERYSIYGGIDVAMFLPIWPEAYGMIMSELRKLGVPTIVTDVGGLGEQVHDGVDGWKVPPYDYGRVIELLNEFIEDRSILRRVRERLANASSRTSYAEKLSRVLDKVSQQNPIPVDSHGMSEKQVSWLRRIEGTKEF